ncbi:hypothetical protein GCM10007989_31160 [Devosia pacifica]|uniref:Uncharacterized protein n=1 Tax=Devosia pacifica TaxID=1335967 RepID=A0A918SBE6_9HYPH|nr:hypothetical protein [Devosia pacifica]GHA32803.1 hypothetical protein GCM10007989_31160 [Devosia pacifica]
MSDTAKDQNSETRLLADRLDAAGLAVSREKQARILPVFQWLRAGAERLQRLEADEKTR